MIASISSLEKIAISFYLIRNVGVALQPAGAAADNSAPEDRS
jgi:hypothetical protein